MLYAGSKWISPFEMVAEVKAILCAAAELDRFDRDVSIHFNASHAENVDAYETASPLTANQLAALQALGRRCAQEQGHPPGQP